jgi:hypothetical protein
LGHPEPGIVAEAAALTTIGGREALRMDCEDGQAPKQQWEPLRLTYMGQVAEVIQVGGGKLSATGGDPDEPRKQRGTG